MTWRVESGELLPRPKRLLLLSQKKLELSSERSPVELAKIAEPPVKAKSIWEPSKITSSQSLPSKRSALSLSTLISFETVKGGELAVVDWSWEPVMLPETEKLKLLSRNWPMPAEAEVAKTEPFEVILDMRDEKLEEKRRPPRRSKRRMNKPSRRYFTSPPTPLLTLGEGSLAERGEVDCQVRKFLMEERRREGKCL